MGRKKKEKVNGSGKNAPESEVKAGEQKSDKKDVYEDPRLKKGGRTDRSLRGLTGGGASVKVIPPETLGPMKELYWKERALTQEQATLNLQFARIEEELNSTRAEMAVQRAVVNNEFGVEIGKTHFWDIDTGEIKVREDNMRQGA